MLRGIVVCGAVAACAAAPACADTPAAPPATTATVTVEGQTAVYAQPAGGCDDGGCVDVVAPQTTLRALPGSRVTVKLAGTTFTTLDVRRGLHLLAATVNGDSFTFRLPSQGLVAYVAETHTGGRWLLPGQLVFRAPGKPSIAVHRTTAGVTVRGNCGLPGHRMVVEASGHRLLRACSSSGRYAALLPGRSRSLRVRVRYLGAASPSATFGRA